MISSLISHPAFPLAIGSLFIFIFKEKANLISIGSILISLFVLLFIMIFLLFMLMFMRLLMMFF